MDDLEALDGGGVAEGGDAIWTALSNEVLGADGENGNGDGVNELP
jgi:hypothetical protein